MTYEEIVKVVADYLYFGDDMDDFEKGELSGAAFAIAKMFNKNKRDVKNDILKALNQ
jgi:hypothetical protein